MLFATDPSAFGFQKSLTLWMKVGCLLRSFLRLNATFILANQPTLSLADMVVVSQMRLNRAPVAIALYGFRYNNNGLLLFCNTVNKFGSWTDWLISIS